MRVFGIFVFIFLIFLGVYFYFTRWKPIVDKVNDLRKENLYLSKKLAEKWGSQESKMFFSKFEISEEKLKVVVPSDEVFVSGTAEISDNGKKVLKDLVNTLKKRGFNKIDIEVHTDNTPVGARLKVLYPTNWELAGARASNIVKFFIQNGIPANKLRAISCGDAYPVTSNLTPEGRKQNRRIIFYIY